MVHDTYALAVERLHKRYGSGPAAVDALVNVDLTFPRGHVHGHHGAVRFGGAPARLTV